MDVREDLVKAIKNQSASEELVPEKLPRLA